MSHAEGPYPHAPIVEAALTLAFADETVFDINDLSRRFDERFPGWEGKEIYKVSDTYVPMTAPPGDLGKDTKLVGFQRVHDGERLRLIEDEIHYVRDYRTNLYEHWDAFIADAMGHLVPLVVGIAGDTVRWAHARFLNELPIPENGEYEIRDWVKLGVEVPEALPQTISRMFTQVDIPFDLDSGLVSSRSTVFAGTRNEKAILVLDIEVSQEFAPRNVNNLEDILTVLRSIKNRLFESSITDACRLQMRGTSE